MAWVVPLLTNVSTAVSAVGAIGAGQARKATNEYEAIQHERNAIEAEGAATREASEVRRQGRVMESDAIAAMVAAGGSSDDAGAIEHLSKIYQANEFEALNSLFQGDVRAREHRMRAASAYQEAENSEREGYMNGITTAIDGAIKYADYRSSRSPSTKPKPTPAPPPLLARR